MARTGGRVSARANDAGRKHREQCSPVAWIHSSPLYRQFLATETIRTRDTSLLQSRLPWHGMRVEGGWHGRCATPAEIYHARSANFAAAASPKSVSRKDTVKDEIRENLICRLQRKEPLFPGVVGFEETVAPQVVNAILSRHNFILLGSARTGEDQAHPPADDSAG